MNIGGRNWSERDFLKASEPAVQDRECAVGFPDQQGHYFINAGGGTEVWPP
ncbi:MAG: hypothetical protein JO275_02420 [Verrucomicrobia bacterium]|nr:hypothetical protein [Verrucomicrobiota bacterium]